MATPGSPCASLHCDQRLASQPSCWKDKPKKDFDEVDFQIEDDEAETTSRQDESVIVHEVGALQQIPGERPSTIKKALPYCDVSELLLPRCARRSCRGDRGCKQAFASYMCSATHCPHNNDSRLYRIYES